MKGTPLFQKTKLKSKRVIMRAVFAVVIQFGVGAALGDECPPKSAQIVTTDLYSLELGSATGARGDVVGVPLVLRSQVVNVGFVSMVLSVCHDPEVVEIVGNPIYSDEFSSLLGPLGAHFFAVRGSEDSRHRGDGFVFVADFFPDLYEARFPSDSPLTLMTIYYRLKGSAGQNGALVLCDMVLGLHNAQCNFNRLYLQQQDERWGHSHVTTRRTSGKLTIREGDATQTERPPEPPRAEIYPDPGSPDEVDFRVVISGTEAQPGAREVPVDVFASAAREYTGILLSFEYDPRYLTLSGAETSFIGGAVTTEYPSVEPGSQCVLFSGLGVSERRLAAAGEVLRVATLYFDVSEAAEEIDETEVRLAASPRPWIGVLHRQGPSIESAVVRSEVSPIAITPGRLVMKSERPVPRGDANGDGRLDVSDPIALLSHLLGGSPELPCPFAADFDGDARLDASDAVSMLGALFLGTSQDGGEGPVELGCR